MDITCIFMQLLTAYVVCSENINFTFKKFNKSPNFLRDGSEEVFGLSVVQIYTIIIITITFNKIK